MRKATIKQTAISNRKIELTLKKGFIVRPLLKTNILLTVNEIYKVKVKVKDFIDLKSKIYIEEPNPSTTK